MQNKRVKAHSILIFSTHTSCESIAYRPFSLSGLEARGVRKVNTGTMSCIPGLVLQEVAPGALLAQQLLQE